MDADGTGRRSFPFESDCIEDDILNNHDKPNDQARPFARVAARELTRDELETVAGGRPPPNHTHATGANGDDPADPGV